MGKPEADVEKFLDKLVTEAGGFTRKWTGRRGVPDRICFLPNGEVWFIEVKTPSRLPTPHQWREIERQRKLGHNSGFIAGRYEVKEFMIHCISMGARQDWMNKQMREARSKMVKKLLEKGEE